MVSLVILPFRIPFLKERANAFFLVFGFHDEREQALLISKSLIQGQARRRSDGRFRKPHGEGAPGRDSIGDFERPLLQARDRKSTRLNSSHSQISYAVFCLKNNTRRA